jgi:hypothetical protein
LFNGTALQQYDINRQQLRGVLFDVRREFLLFFEQFVTLLKCLFITLVFGTESRLKAARSVVRFRAGEKFSLLQNGFQAHPTSYSLATGVISLEFKQPSCGVDRSRLPTGDVKSKWSRTSTSTCFHGLHRDTLTLICCGIYYYANQPTNRMILFSKFAGQKYLM